MKRTGELKLDLDPYDDEIDTDVELQPGDVILVGPPPVDIRETMIVGKGGTLMRGVYGSQPTEIFRAGSPVVIIGIAALDET